MKEEKDQIIIDHLDHVAIRVKDMDASAKWYKGDWDSSGINCRNGVSILS